jgi:5'(3')-deoxyribonucleotidase
MIFLCDVDGVLADFTGAIVTAINDHLDALAETSAIPIPHKSVAEVTEWDIASCLDVPASLIYAKAGEPGFCESLKVLPGAVALVETLRLHGKVYFVTSPIWSAPLWMYERTHWLKKHFDAKPGEVMHTSAKELVRGDMLIDDKPQTVERWAMAQGLEPYTNYGVIWNQPYNAKYTIDRRYPVVRAQNWEDVEELIQRRKKEHDHARL